MRVFRGPDPPSMLFENEAEAAVKNGHKTSPKDAGRKQGSPKIVARRSPTNRSPSGSTAGQQGLNWIQQLMNKHNYTLDDLYRFFDADQNGTLMFSEFVLGMKQIGASPDQCQTIWTSIDPFDTGAAEIEDFKMALAALKYGAKSPRAKIASGNQFKTNHILQELLQLNEGNLEITFKAIDLNGNDWLSKQEFARGLSALNIGQGGLDPKEVKEAFASLDENADGRINWSEFIQVMTKVKYASVNSNSTSTSVTPRTSHTPRTPRDVNTPRGGNGTPHRGFHQAVSPQTVPEEGHMDPAFKLGNIPTTQPKPTQASPPAARASNLPSGFPGSKPKPGAKGECTSATGLYGIVFQQARSCLLPATQSPSSSIIVSRSRIGAKLTSKCLFFVQPPPGRLALLGHHLCGLHHLMTWMKMMTAAKQKHSTPLASNHRQ